MIDERIAARRRGVREHRRRSRLRRTLLVVGLVVVVVALVVVERSALVGLEEVRVVGTERLSAEEVREASELELGTSTLRLGLSRVQERIEALPLVERADARRVDPLTVRVEVVEREPSLVVVGADRPVLVDRHGVVIAEGEEGGLPRVRLQQAPPEPGQEVAALPALENAHAAWRGLTGPLRAMVARYDAAGPDDLELVLESGVRVRFGRAERVEEKARALGVVLEDAGRTEVSVIDVRAPAAPVVVP